MMLMRKYKVLFITSVLLIPVCITGLALSSNISSLPSYLWLLTSMLLVITLSTAALNLSENYSKSIHSLKERLQALDHIHSGNDNGPEVIDNRQNITFSEVELKKIWNDSEDSYDLLMRYIIKLTDAVMGISYVYYDENNQFEFNTAFGFNPDPIPESFKFSDSMAGEAASAKIPHFTSEIPENVNTVSSGLGKSVPKFLVFFPVVNNNKTTAVLELGYFKALHQVDIDLLKKICMFSQPNS